jgi:molybdate transport system substrate-binding protein
MLNKLAIVFALLIVAGSSASAQTITVAAAANLASVLNNKIVPAFEQSSHINVKVVVGATKTLEQQMENGAPYDVFISADTATVKKLAGENLIDGGSVAPYAIGELVMWSRNDAKVHPATIADLADPSIEHIAIANPQTAPYGAATIEALTKANLLDAFQPKIVRAENIQQSLEYAATGNADVSFTALSLVIGRTDGVYSIVPDFLHAPIEQSLGIKIHASSAAKKFAQYLTSPTEDTIWTSSGYRLPQR